MSSKSIEVTNTPNDGKYFVNGVCQKVGLYYLFIKAIGGGGTGSPNYMRLITKVNTESNLSSFLGWPGATNCEGYASIVQYLNIGDTVSFKFESAGTTLSGQKRLFIPLQVWN